MLVEAYNALFDKCIIRVRATEKSHDHIMREVKKMPEQTGPNLRAKDAVSAVRAFINDLYGPDGVRYSQVEEIEFVPADYEWHVTMSFTSATNMVINPNARDFKTFRIDADSGTVLSMRIPRD